MAETLFNRWSNVVSENRNDLVFENRNKAYGAYVIRRKYSKTVTLAVGITLLSFSALVSVPIIIDYINNKAEEEVVAVDITPTDLTAPPPIDESTPPPPPPPPPPPVMETVKFTPPVVTDEEVKEDPPPVQTEETPQISTVTQEGTGNKDEIIIPEETGPAVVAPVAEQIFTVVEQPATFPGGEKAMQKWINDRIGQKGYPAMEREAGISGTCYVTFVVEKDGSITDVKILRGVANGPGYSKLATEVIKEMPPWKAGKQNGHEVRVQFNLPIKFTLK